MLGPHAHSRLRHPPPTKQPRSRDDMRRLIVPLLPWPAAAAFHPPASASVSHHPLFSSSSRRLNSCSCRRATTATRGMGGVGAINGGRGDPVADGSLWTSVGPVCLSQAQSLSHSAQRQPAILLQMSAHTASHSDTRRMRWQWRSNIRLEPRPTSDTDSAPEAERDAEPLSRTS